MSVIQMIAKRERDFSQPLCANYVVSLKARNGDFCLFVASFFKKNGKSYLKHTTDIAEAKRFTRIIAEEVAEEVKEYRCTGRVEQVSPDNSQRTIVDPLLKQRA